MHKNSKYSLMSVSLFFDNKRLDQGEFTFGITNGSSLIQLSEEAQGTPLPSKIDPRTIIYTIKINPTMNSETHDFLVDYMVKEVLSDSMNFEKPLYFNDGKTIYRTENAFCLPPDEFSYPNLASQSEFTLYAYNLIPELIKR